MYSKRHIFNCGMQVYNDFLAFFNAISLGVSNIFLHTHTHTGATVVASNHFFIFAYARVNGVAKLSGNGLLWDSVACVVVSDG